MQMTAPDARAVHQLGRRGYEALDTWRRWFEDHRLEMMVLPTLVLAACVTTAIVPTMLVGEPGWWVTAATTGIFITATTTLLVFVATRLVVHVGDRSDCARVIGYLTSRHGEWNPSLVYNQRRWGGLARRWLRGCNLSPTELDTFHRLAGEWDGSASELVSFAVHLSD